jgi:hypothetical protein
MRARVGDAWFVLAVLAEAAVECWRDWRAGMTRR